ncbi:MAG: hypothetical protein RLZZ422_103 [Pseudomonadota bacterium]|jgi:ABC-type Na+ efflux pump permease subunit
MAIIVLIGYVALALLLGAKASDVGRSFLLWSFLGLLNPPIAWLVFLIFVKGK